MMSEHGNKPPLPNLIERLRRHESLSEDEMEFIASQLEHGAVAERGPGRPRIPLDKLTWKTIKTAVVAEQIYHGTFPEGLSDVDPDLAAAITQAKGSRTQADGVAADIFCLKGPSAVAKARARIYPTPQQRERFRNEPIDQERWEEFKHLLRAKVSQKITL